MPLLHDLKNVVLVKVIYSRHIREHVSRRSHLEIGLKKCIMMMMLLFFSQK